MVGKIVSRLPDCRRYCEPFGGGASILLARTPVELEVYNDLNEDLFHFFTVLADPRLFAEFYRRVIFLPYSRQIYNHYRKTWQDTENPVERAAKWFVVAAQSFGGHFAHSWGRAVTKSCRSMVGTCSTWQSRLDRLPLIHARLARVQIENLDWRECLEAYDTPETLFYCDPPYIASTRKHEFYAHEMSEADHEELVSRLLEVKGLAAVSTYPHAIYRKLARAGWREHRFRTACHAAARTRVTGIQGKSAATRMQPRTEVLYVKPTRSCTP